MKRSGSTCAFAPVRQFKKGTIAAVLLALAGVPALALGAPESADLVPAVAAIACAGLTAVLVPLVMRERRRAQRAEAELDLQRAELIHAARLALVGELTASIAHQINQPLAAILSNADAAEMMLESEGARLEEVRHILADIRRDNLRASDVIRHLKSLLQKRAVERTPVDVNELLLDVVRLMRHDAQRRGAVLRIELDHSAPAVTGDRVQLEQVVLNLVLNGIDAVSSPPEANRTVTVRSVARDSGIEVAVSDTGRGIAPEIAGSLFTPFRSTKQGGLGLGLSVARLIVQAHGGRIWAEPSTAGGALFKFCLPAGAHAAHVAVAEQQHLDSVA